MSVGAATAESQHQFHPGPIGSPPCPMLFCLCMTGDSAAIQTTATRNPLIPSAMSFGGMSLVLQRPSFESINKTATCCLNLTTHDIAPPAGVMQFRGKSLFRAPRRVGPHCQAAVRATVAPCARGLGCRKRHFPLLMSWRLRASLSRRRICCRYVHTRPARLLYLVVPPRLLLDPLESARTACEVLRSH